MGLVYRSARILVVFGFILSSCTPSSTSVIETATPSPAPMMRDPEIVEFSAPDDAVLTGMLYGSGDVAVIFSVMGNCKRGWEDMAELVAQHGMTALTYQWRGCRAAGGAVDRELRKFVDDLRGAILYMRAQGAEKIILAGASLGGVASAKLAVESSADGLIIVASPRNIEDWGFEITLGDVNIGMPKLFITSENDSVVPIERSRELFDLLAEPKQWQSYPGAAHGTDIFETESGEAMLVRILDFILEIAAKH